MVGDCGVIENGVKIVEGERRSERERERNMRSGREKENKRGSRQREREYGWDRGTVRDNERKTIKRRCTKAFIILNSIKAGSFRIRSF